MLEVTYLSLSSLVVLQLNWHQLYYNALSFLCFVLVCPASMSVYLLLLLFMLCVRLDV